MPPRGDFKLHHDQKSVPVDNRSAEGYDAQTDAVLSRSYMVMFHNPFDFS